jgi:hypothetical protein
MLIDAQGKFSGNHKLSTKVKAARGIWAASMF